jgi:hypothetical protein
MLGNRTQEMRATIHDDRVQRERPKTVPTQCSRFFGAHIASSKEIRRSFRIRTSKALTHQKEEYFLNGTLHAQTQNLLAVTPDARLLFVGWGSKLKIYNIHIADKGILEHTKSIKTIPGCKIRSLKVVPVVNQDGTTTFHLVIISNLGICIFQTNRIDAPPVILGLGSPHVCMAFRGGFLAAANESNEIVVWNLGSTLDKKSTSEETLVLDQGVADIAFSKDDGSQLLVLGNDGKLRVFSLGLVRMCVSEQDILPPNSYVLRRHSFAALLTCATAPSVAALVALPRISVIVDNSDAVRLFDSTELLRTNLKTVDIDRSSVSVHRKASDQGQIFKHQLLRIPLPSSSLYQPRVFVDFVDDLSLIVTCTAQSGQLDLVKVSLDDAQLLKPVSSWHHTCTVQGFAVASTATFSYIFSLLDNHDVFCLSLEKTEHIKTSGSGPSMEILKVAVPSIAPAPSLTTEDGLAKKIIRNRTSRARTRSEVQPIQVTAISSTSSSPSSSLRNGNADDNEATQSQMHDHWSGFDHDDTDPISFSAPERDTGLLAAIVRREESEDASEFLPSPTEKHYSSGLPVIVEEDVSDTASNDSASPRTPSLRSLHKKSVSTLSLISSAQSAALSRSRALGASNDLLPQFTGPATPWRKGAALPTALKNVKSDLPS